ncbi:MAG TPA: hypothetical protein VHU84_02570 [Lacipirellulaceae bacterium]|jgi:hypothetical protein|nr:hypothetical protein [Lacipirellulaceae bacterium]
MTHIASFSNSEEKLIRALAKRRDQGGSRFGTDEIASFFDNDDHFAYGVAQRLVNYGMLSMGDCIDEWRIESSVLDAVHQWDHSDPKDYWKSVTRWFKSKWWSIPVLLVFVCLPLLVKWIEMIKTVLIWIGISQQ